MSADGTNGNGAAAAARFLELKHSIKRVCFVCMSPHSQFDRSILCVCVCVLCAYIQVLISVSAWFEFDLLYASADGDSLWINMSMCALQVESFANDQPLLCSTAVGQFVSIALSFVKPGNLQLEKPVVALAVVEGLQHGLSKKTTIQPLVSTCHPRGGIWALSF